MKKILSVKVSKNTSYLNRYPKLCYQYSQELIDTTKKINLIKNWQELDNQSILNCYNNYQKAVLQLIPFLNSALVLDGILKKEIKKILLFKLKISSEKKQDLLLSNLIIPKKKSFFVQETEALEQIALKVRKNPSAKVASDIKTFVKIFAWMPSIAYIGEFQTERSVLNRVRKLSKENIEEKISQAKEVKRESYNRYKKAFQEIENYKKLVNLINLAREFLYLVTYRLDVFFMVYYLVYPMFKEIAKRHKLGPELLVFLTGDEIIGLLKGDIEVNKEEIVERSNNYSLIKLGKIFQIYSGRKIKRDVSKQIQKTSVKGMVANRGRATGKARMVMGIDDTQKVKSGDIMISPMTEPQYVPAMSKVTGIITDFGGILRHAAIVSREFGIPCIVGTKNATKVFKDGDLVELNAYEGVARVIRGK